MSSTVIHPERISGRFPSKRTIGMVLAGLVVSAGIGFAIANQNTETVAGVGQVQVDSADTKFHQLGAQLAAERQMLQLEATKGVELGVTAKPFSRLGGELNQIPAASTTPLAIEAVRSQDKVNYMTEQFWALNVTALDKQAAAWESRADYLAEQYRSFEEGPGPR